MNADEQRRFPILRASRGYTKPHPTSIPWSVAEKAYGVYRAKYGNGQSLERLAERGGFSPDEMDMFHDGWIEETSLIRRQAARIETLVGLLRPHEWTGGANLGSMCRHCNAFYSQGHKPDCPLKAALEDQT